MREIAFGRDTCWGFHSIMRFPPGWYWWRKQQPERRRRGNQPPEAGTHFAINKPEAFCPFRSPSYAPE
jgi:hypothetical protein